MWHQSQHYLVLCDRDRQRKHLPVQSPVALGVLPCTLGSSAAELLGLADFERLSHQSNLIILSVVNWHLDNTEILQRATEATLNINDLSISNRKKKKSMNSESCSTLICRILFSHSRFFYKMLMLFFPQMLSCGLSFVFLTIIFADNLSNLLLCKKNPVFCDNLI